MTALLAWLGQVIRGPYHARHLATREIDPGSNQSPIWGKLGHRAGMDAFEAERRELREKRFTSLDRMILRGAEFASHLWQDHIRGKVML